MNINIARKYFKFWASKDLNGLNEIIHENCVLEDWETKICGKNEIKDLNEAFFKTNDVDLKINNMIESNDEVWSNLTITINNKDKIEVVDILSFLDNQVIKIRAFKG